MQAIFEIRRGTRIALGTVGLAILGVAAVADATPADTANAKPQPITVNIMADVVKATPDTIRAGQVTFQVMNRSSTMQDFEISGPKLDTDLDDIGVGATRSVTMNINPGTYRLEASEQDGNNERVSLLTVLPR